MRFATSSAVVLTASTVLAAANPAVLIRRQDCQQGYSSCAPQGATTSALPPVGTALASLYSNLLDTAKNAPADSSSSRKARRDGGAGVFARDAPSMCCASGSACLNLQNYNVPMCYDHFTTNFILPDGSYGTLDSGLYHAADGGGAFLGNGSFSTAGGKPTGNLYGDAAHAPNTATLPVPTPFTGTGVGSAIPATALGGLATYTLTLAGTTVAPTTVSGSVVEQGTTMAPSTTTVTTIAPAGASSTGAAPLPTPFVGAAAGALGAFVVAVAAL